MNTHNAHGQPIAIPFHYIQPCVENYCMKTGYINRRCILYIPVGRAKVTQSLKKKHGKSPFLCLSDDAIWRRMSEARWGEAWHGRYLTDLAAASVAANRTASISSWRNLSAKCTRVWPTSKALGRDNSNTSSAVNCRDGLPPAAIKASIALGSLSTTPRHAFSQSQSLSWSRLLNSFKWQSSTMEVPAPVAPTLSELSGLHVAVEAHLWHLAVSWNSVMFVVTLTLLTDTGDRMVVLLVTQLWMLESDSVLPRAVPHSVHFVDRCQFS